MGGGGGGRGRGEGEEGREGGREGEEGGRRRREGGEDKCTWVRVQEYMYTLASSPGSPPHVMLMRDL